MEEELLEDITPQFSSDLQDESITGSYRRSIKNGVLYPIRQISEDTDINRWDEVIVIDATSAPVTAQAPLGIKGQRYTAIKKDASANTASIDVTSPDTLNGSSSFVLTTQYETITIQFDGATFN